MYALYYYPGNASLLPHMMLREIGAPFELRLVDRAQGAQHDEAYLRLNPNGRIPVLVQDDLVLFETAAIALHLVDQHPEAGLAPPPGTPARAAFYKWMIHLTNTPQAEYRAWFYPEQHVADPACAPSVKQASGERLGRMFDIIAGQLGDGPYLLGERFSAADLFLLMLVRWAARCRTRRAGSRRWPITRPMCWPALPSKLRSPPRGSKGASSRTSGGAVTV